MITYSKKKQEGVALIGVAIFLLISILIVSLRQVIDERSDQESVESVVTSFTLLAQAQWRHFTDPGSATSGAYAATPALLQTRGYLPIWNGDNNWSFDVSSGLVIDWVAPDLEFARSIQSRMPNITNVDTGTNTVSIGFSDTQDLALLDTFVRRAGDTMEGALAFQAGIGEALDLNQNEIVDVSRLVVKSSDGSALLEVDSVVADTVIAGDFLVSD